MLEAEISSEAVGYCHNSYHVFQIVEAQNPKEA